MQCSGPTLSEVKLLLININLGGIHLTDWKVSDAQQGIWTASTPIGLESRHFFADQQHAQRARQALNRTWLANFTNGYQVVNDKAQFLLTTAGIEYGEIRGINSFTDRYVPIDSIGPNKTLVMAQPAWQNNIIGYDTIIFPFADNGFFVENVLAFLDEANEYYLNSTTGTIYYKPPQSVKPSQMYLVLARLEQLLVVSGTYDAPVHDITFEGFNYMHTTWNYPSSDVGYADQQTGGYIGLNVSYPANLFEASRPHWYVNFDHVLATWLGFCSRPTRPLFDSFADPFAFLFIGGKYRALCKRALQAISRLRAGAWWHSWAVSVLATIQTRIPVELV